MGQTQCVEPPHPSGDCPTPPWNAGDGDFTVHRGPILLTPLEKWAFAMLNVIFSIVLFLLAAAFLIAVVKLIFFT